ncbi:MAG: FtsW/RodA/SpoVE family cell cycle protein [Flavobacteriales bacterium]|jgi:cell division protein FtsW|uniref:FtsW/RodA/SpoVE family cell cycle protein n=1 Tax=Blattabacterium sp. (Mastotermes darwiniensis) TaxID=39768 RepID=UPI000231DF9C|nr:FtsW/RodA/SpoVE family cell cycle protein [Blattabacterium sp. (Mastotermes darwiniensis)]AER40436.1 rod shape-determining protein rodA [Blattabacterium sp. (Mastotermes darwiniensis) str. MADAR]MDR1804842.1 FtsW/RodA/SpoVE family cell cycle protein [Flavobacteriales bacterium]
MRKIDIFLNRYIKGDRYLWAFITLLSIFSFLPVYSASTNLVTTYGGTNTVFRYLFKHALFLLVGFCILFLTQFIDYKYFYRMSILTIPIILVLLFFTIIQEKELDGVNASRWLHIPILNISFQTSNIAGLVLFIYCARYLASKNKERMNFIHSFFPLIFPIFFILGLIFPANGSTAVIVFISVLIILLIGGYPFTGVIGILLMGIVAAGIYIYSVIKWGEKKPMNRVYTWKNRIENFLDKDSEESYQIKQSKMAIVLGNKFGRGPGKSVFKAFLPQSSSDFIYSIVIEEYGSFGGILLLFIYILILLRIMVIATKVPNYFCTLLVLSVGLPIINQALINMGIAVGLFPVTGQTLPLISAGGTSMWVTFFSFGIILSVSRIIYDNPIDQRKKINNE